MPRRQKTATEVIQVVDQTGKRHVVLKYVERDVTAAGEDSAAPNSVEEYRLQGGRVVLKTGSDTFRSVDGHFWLRAL